MGLKFIQQEITFPKNNLVIAENAYRILKNGNFVNGKNIFADEFSDSNGKNNTVNTEESTALFDTVNKCYSLKNNFENTLNLSQGSILNTDNISMTILCKNGGYIKKININTSGGSGTLRCTITAGGTTILNKTGLSFGNIILTENDYTRLINQDEEIILTIAEDSGDLIFQKTQNTSNYNSNTMSIQNQRVINGSIIYQVKETKKSGKIKIGSNTIEFNNNENTFCLFADSDIPTGTSITYNLSDGTSTLLNLNFGDDVNISNLNIGTAILTFNFNGSGENTPKLYGFAGIVIRWLKKF